MPNQKDDRSSQQGNVSNTPGRQDQPQKQGDQKGNRSRDMENKGQQDPNRPNQQGKQGGDMPNRNQGQNEKTSSDRNTSSSLESDKNKGDSERSRSSNQGIKEGSDE